MTSSSLLLTCEHASAFVPPHHRHLFATFVARRLLTSHSGYDIGALALAKSLRQHFGCLLIEGRVTRLLVDLNRSPRHPKLFSSYSRRLGAKDRQSLLEQHYFPYRDRVTQHVAELVERRGHAVHVSVHSFTPRLQGSVRRADIGLLYDPRRQGELALAVAWQRQLGLEAPWLRVRRNYPYRGKDDGFTRALRAQHSAACYRGLELEVNQRLLRQLRGATLERLKGALSRSLAAALQSVG